MSALTGFIAVITVILAVVLSILFSRIAEYPVNLSQKNRAYVWFIIYIFIMCLIYLRHMNLQHLQ